MSSTRLLGAAMTLVLTLTGVYTQQRMGVSYAVPLTNTILALLMATYS